jgi:hypoxanthine phosphoribosyltransferase
MQITVADLTFEPLIALEEIEQRVGELAQKINSDYAGRTPVFIGVLNGSFMLVADLVKKIDIPCEVTFSKLSSYFGGTVSTRAIKDDNYMSTPIAGRDIVLIEDIVDTGNTLTYLIQKLRLQKPASIAACSLLLKPKALEHQIDELKYVGFEIENDFVIGYGLDYKDLGRNLKGIYRKIAD